METPVTFAQLLTQVEKIDWPGADPFYDFPSQDLSDELIQVMAGSKKICPHLHLPLQSGSTRILKKMNRKYTKEDYLNLVEKLRNACRTFH